MTWFLRNYQQQFMIQWYTHAFFNAPASYQSAMAAFTSFSCSLACTCTTAWTKQPLGREGSCSTAHG